MAVETEYRSVGAGDHVVHFYADPSDLAATVAEHLARAIWEGGAAISITTEAHRRALAAELEASGIDVQASLDDGSLTMLDAEATMGSFMPGGVIDPDAFRAVIGSRVAGALETGRPVHAYGEMVASLWEAGDVLAAIDLEKLWNQLGRELEFSLLCGYCAESVSDPEQAGALAEVCRLHSSVHRPSTEATAHSKPPVAAEFIATVDAPAAARHFVADVLRRWGHEADVVEDAKLIVSELATNAVVHAGSAFRLAVEDEARGLRLTVRDSSPVAPAPREQHRTSASGHGLHLIAAIAADWGVELTSDGKAIWVELRG